MERGYQGAQTSDNQPESDAHQAAEKRREHECAAKEKEAAYAGGTPLLLGWLSPETADMVVQMGVASVVSAYLLTSSTQKGSRIRSERRGRLFSRRAAGWKGSRGKAEVAARRRSSFAMSLLTSQPQTATSGRIACAVSTHPRGQTRAELHGGWAYRLIHMEAALHIAPILRCKR